MHQVQQLVKPIHVNSSTDQLYIGNTTFHLQQNFRMRSIFTENPTLHRMIIFTLIKELHLYFTVRTWKVLITKKDRTGRIVTM
jgi:hypothetical protein